MNRNPTFENDEDSVIIAVPELFKFVIDCFVATGLNRTNSEIMADSIIGADLMGHRSHGVFRLDKYVQESNSGSIDRKATPKIEKETSTTAWVNGQNALGPIVANFCMKIAIEKAKQVGAALVVAKVSNNFGVVGNFTKQALKEDLLALAFTNSSPLMVPTRGKYAILGTNPLSLAAPALFDDYFLLDMASTLTSGGNIEIRVKRNETLPVGFAINPACLDETDADVARKTARFLPLGSYEVTGSYKGTGLAMMCDILTGILGGGSYGDSIGQWESRCSGGVKPANICHCFIVIDHKAFAPDFQFRLTDYLNLIRNLEPLDPKEPVRVPGDLGKRMKTKIEAEGCLRYEKFVHDTLNQVAKLLKIKPINIVPKEEPVRISSSQDLEPEITARPSPNSDPQI